MEERTTSLHPDEIASMTVYKDSVAVAKYGENGRNGVVEIVTKKE